ncbi:MAG: HAMP domain-containing histidine kinase [Tannerella sp.]|nr:HAMP domain-containing histidine kinase [Tannerella sp.]
MLTVLWLFQTVLLDTTYKRIRESGIRHSAAKIIDNIENENLSEIIRDISYNSNIGVLITDLSGNNLLHDLPSDNVRGVHTSNKELIAKAQNNGGEINEYITFSPESLGENNPAFNRTEDERPVRVAGRPPMQSLIYVKIAANSLGEQFAVIVQAVISPVNATVAALRYQLYFLSGIIIFLAVILAMIIANHVSKPIEEISKNAMKLAAGNYDTRFTEKGFHEIASLSNTLNTTAIELGRAESLRRDLLANVSHDLRTPLALIYSYAEMMHDFPGEITPEQTLTIMDETKWLSALVSDVLDISKMENEMDNLTPSQYNLTHAIFDTTERVKKLTSKKGLEISVINDGDIYVNADKTKIDRALYNLLINAINYSGDSRNITVEQKNINNHVRVSVIDQGDGITESDLPFIWDRYYKIGETHKRADTGSGLGLSIVKKIIDIHGGKSGVISEIGKGSTFWFEIKIA